MFERGMDKAARVSDKRMKEIERSAKKLGKDIGKSLAAIGAVVGAGIGLYIKNTVDFQNEQAQLAARLKSTGGVAGQTMQSLDALATEMRRTTAVTGDQISKAQDLLLTFTNVRGAIYDRAIPAILDMSVAMRQEAGASAILLGKALNDPIKGIAALGRAGVQFSEDQRELIKTLVETGEIAKAQEIILKELETQFGGSAAAARNTLGGALINLRESFDELLEGRDGGLNKTVDQINALADGLADPSLKAGLDTLVNGLLRAANAAVTAASRLAEFIGQYKNFLANQGLVPGDELNQLEARRAQLEKSKSTPIGFFSKDKINAELARVDAQIARYPWRGVSGGAMGSWELAKPHAPGGGGSGKSKKTGKSDAEKEAEALARAYQSMNERLQEQEFMLGKTGEAARIRYEIELGSLQALAPAMKEQLLARAEAYDLLVAEREEEEKSLKRAQEETAAIKRGIEDTQQLIQDMEFELALIGMTNRERERAIALRYADAHATDEQIQKIMALSDALYEARKANELWMEFQGSLADAFVDLATGAKSLKEALTDFFDSIAAAITRSIAESWAETITGWFKGASSGGSGGGGSWWQGLLQSFFGGGKASGGSVRGGMLYEVNEQGTEMFSAGGRDYLLAGTDGHITPAHKLGGSIVQNVQFLMPERASPSTQSQIAQRTGIATQTAARRNG